MRRADRLFQIVQFLRSRRLTTAEWLAEKLEVSVRTIYRDIADLGRSGVPVEGEAGVGYMLRHKLDLPPLMFDRNELAAIELGLRFVSAYTGRPLSRVASSAMSKIRTALPKNNDGNMAPTALYVPKKSNEIAPSFGSFLAAIDGKRKVRIIYADVKGQETNRIIWPLGAFFWGGAWTVLAWCELRNDFRSFHLARMRQIEDLPEHYPDSPGRRLSDYFRSMEKVHAVPMSDFDPL